MLLLLGFKQVIAKNCPKKFAKFVQLARNDCRQTFEDRLVHFFLQIIARFALIRVFLVC